MYEYITPSGYADTFFVYVVNGEDLGLVNGNNYALLGLTVQDTDFVCRIWSGGVQLVNLASGTVQMYDSARNSWFQQPILQGNFPPAMAVLPEKIYLVNSNFRFDLTDVSLRVNTNGTASVYADQIAWYGVKRAPGVVSDPAPSTYKYYEKPFSYPYIITIQNYGPSDSLGNPIAGLAVPTQYIILVTDYDFELRRILMINTASGTGGPAIFYSEGGPQMQVVSVGGASGTVTITAGTSGTTGPPNQSLSITVVAGAVTVTLATNSFGFVISTLTDVINIINTTPASSAIALASALGSGLPNYPQTAAFGPGAASVSPYASPFKIMLYDGTRRQRTNIPILAELLCMNLHSNAPASQASSNNAWPTPPLNYQVNSVIRFDIYSLIPTGDSLPTTVNLLFDGVRRIPC